MNANRIPDRRSKPACTALLLVAGLILAGGCKPSATPEQAATEVRGAPIQTTPRTDPSVTGSNQTPTSVASAPAPAPAGKAAPSSGSVPAAPAGQPASISFDQLAGYTFEVSDELLGPVTNDVAAATQKTDAQIPEPVKRLDQKKVALRGFMLPLKVEGGLVTEMLIMKDQSMCCYGSTPRINDWVSVKMRNKGVRPLMDLPVTLYGTLKVGEMRENGYLVGIYSMDGEGMEAPEIK